ncbi:hypothetical protein BDF20DRAFT_916749 [Mycotypha africana]|uniref:uncharacterized protein n=1 Tax=Mycotypha africana TaxID=64632 RepID=UPI002300AEF9|nr:uncharacterized protein BDF20DRAFT_916749 [Mycotypha africana]KAI8968194.1 hypothetical protein BDF20DRAFT_916749 [Mycotypha africana]
MPMVKNLEDYHQELMNIAKESNQLAYRNYSADEVEKLQQRLRHIDSAYNEGAFRCGEMTSSTASRYEEEGLAQVTDELEKVHNTLHPFLGLLVSYLLVYTAIPISALAVAKQHPTNVSHLVDPNEGLYAASTEFEHDGNTHPPHTENNHLNSTEDGSNQIAQPTASIMDKINQVIRFGPVAVDQHRENAGPPQEIEPYLIKNDNETEAIMDPTTVDSVSTGSASIGVGETPATVTSHAPVPKMTNCKTHGQVALTYSEGPSDVTAKIARELKNADAHATFFVNATWLHAQQYAMVVQNLYNAGHLIGMTYRVPNDDHTALSDEELRDDIIKNAEIIEKVIQVGAPKYVRLHYTEVEDTRTENILNQMGFVVVGYNLDSQDYIKKEVTGPNSIQQAYADMFRKYKDTYDVKGSFISIQYDLPYTRSLSAAPYVINTIDKEGYTMVRLDGCLNDPAPYKESAASSEYVTDKFSFGQPEYHQGQKAVVIQEVSDPMEEDENDMIHEDDFHIQSFFEGKAYSVIKSAGSAIWITTLLLIVLF